MKDSSYIWLKQIKFFTLFHSTASLNYKYWFITNKYTNIRMYYPQSSYWEGQGRWRIWNQDIWFEDWYCSNYIFQWDIITWIYLTNCIFFECIVIRLSKCYISISEHFEFSLDSKNSSDVSIIDVSVHFIGSGLILFFSVLALVTWNGKK
jgi:hypothetical protein